MYSDEIGQQTNLLLLNLDSAFITAHATANKLNLDTGGPIILLRDGQLVLIRNKTEVSTQVILPDYQVFKTFAHVPVAIYLMLEPHGVGNFDTQRLEQLQNYRAELEIVENNIKQIGLSGADLERQKSILTESKQFLDKIIQQQSFTSGELRSFTRHMLPLIQENIACAAASQLKAMHRQVMAWKQEMSPAEWKELRVAVKGAVLARQGNLVKQYFQRLMHEDSEGVRLVYMELYFPPTPMQTLLATRAIDRGISSAVFGNPDRMFTDVLADAAEAHIKCMKFE